MPTNHRVSFQISYPNKLSKIYYEILIPASFTVLLLMLEACGSNNSAKEDSNGEKPDVDMTVKIKQLTAEEAINKVKYEFKQSRKTMIVEVHYWDTEMTRVPCTQYDVDYGRGCSGEGIGAPYGYKRVAKQVKKCCRQKEIPIYTTQGQWTAVYTEPEDKWAVEYEFGVEDVKKVFSWIVGDKDGVVGETGSTSAAVTNTSEVKDTIRK